MKDALSGQVLEGANVSESWGKSGRTKMPIPNLGQVRTAHAQTIPHTTQTQTRFVHLSELCLLLYVLRTWQRPYTNKQGLFQVYQSWITTKIFSLL